MKNFTPEMIEKAKAAKTAEELLALAKENNVEMTEEEANAYFAQLNPVSGELSDDELDNVAGGGCGGGSKESTYTLDNGNRRCKICNCKDFYKRGSRERPYYICCDCGEVGYDPFQYFEHEGN